EAFHSSYERNLADLPIAGRQAVIDCEYVGHERAIDGWKIGPGPIPADQPTEITEWAQPRRSPMPIVRCGQVMANDATCNRPAFVFDARQRRMLCREHMLGPLERVFGSRPDLEEKAEYVLRFLGLPSEHRHELLEALGPEERREFIELARLFEGEAT